MEELLCDVEYVYFEKIVEINKVFFGDITIENADKSLLNLSTELCKNKIVKMSTDFAKG